MIVELADTVSSLSHDKNIERLTYQRTLFPAPATKEEYHQISANSISAGRQLTFPMDPGPIEANSVQMFSIPRKFRFERTMPQSLCGAIRRQGGDFSMDQGERANFKYPSVTCRLLESLSASC